MKNLKEYLNEIEIQSLLNDFQNGLDFIESMNRFSKIKIINEESIEKTIYNNLDNYRKAPMGGIWLKDIFSKNKKEE